jgi:hypothetical protein
MVNSIFIVFIQIQVPWLEEEEANLVAELRDKNADNQNERPQSATAGVGNMQEGEKDGGGNQQPDNNGEENWIFGQFYFIYINFKK